MNRTVISDSRSIVFSHDLDETVYGSNATFFNIKRLDSFNDTLYINNRLRWGYFRETLQDTNGQVFEQWTLSESRYASLIGQRIMGNTFLDETVDNIYYIALLTTENNGDIPDYEILTQYKYYSGFYEMDLLLAPDLNPLIAKQFYSTCISVQGSETDTLWNRKTGDLIFHGTDTDKKTVYGLANDSVVVFLSILDGQPVDSIDLERKIFNPKFFYTDNNHDILNLMGTSNDTSFVFQFLTPTDVPEHPDRPTNPESFKLSNNYPNPFNPSTTIDYYVPFRSNITLSVYNLLGQKVATLVDGVKGKGHYQVEWMGVNQAGQQVASGIYLYRLETDNYSESKKMLLLK